MVGVVNAVGEVQLHRLSLDGPSGEGEARGSSTSEPGEDDTDIPGAETRCPVSSETAGPEPHCTEIERVRIADDDDRLALSLDWSNALQHR